jgi:hypothetical protein
MKRSRLTKFIFLVIVVAPVAIFLFGSVVMLLWNNVLTPVLHVSEITFWQGLGLLVLSKILFGSFGGRGRYRRDFGKQRIMWNSMTPEQKEKFKEEWRGRSHRCGYRSGDAEKGFEQPGAVS